MKIIFLRQAHRFIKKADRSLRDKIEDEVLKIKKRPDLGKRLSGRSLRGILAHRFVHVRVHYRIAYQVKGDLIIISVASRENFYRDLGV